MKSEFYLLTTILIILSIKSVKSATFCDQKNMDAVFTIDDETYLVRGENFWISNIVINTGKPDPTPRTIQQRFKGLNFKKLMTGFVVESVPEYCEKRSEEEKCRFIDYMLNTAFIFYRRDDKTQQIYSMMKWDTKTLTFIFDDQIGGYGYMLRANRTVGRSTWPGITDSSDQILGTLFVKERNEIVLFIEKSGAKITEVVKKPLNELWDAKAYPNLLANQNGRMIGTFRRGNQYYFVANSTVFKFKDSIDFTDYEKVSKEREFFGCQ